MLLNRGYLFSYSMFVFQPTIKSTPLKKESQLFNDLLNLHYFILTLKFISRNITVLELPDILILFQHHLKKKPMRLALPCGFFWFGLIHHFIC